MTPRKQDRIALVFDYDLAYPRGVLRGIKAFAQSTPNWILVPLGNRSETLRTLRLAKPSGVIALVTSGTLLRTLESLDCPVVDVGTLVSDDSLSRIAVDNRKVGRMAASHLCDCGLRHFGFVGHPRHFYSKEREAGFRERLMEGGFDHSSFYERQKRSFRERGRLLVFDRGLQRWLRSLPKPVGIFACHDVWGLQVIEACRMVGLRVPEDVAVIGSDNDDILCELARPSLSSIVVPGERIGFEASRLLHRLLMRGKPARTPILFPPAHVVPRQSSNLLAGKDPDVAAALRFIHDHAARPLKVEEVLTAVPASRRSLERRFRKVLGRGLGEEIRRVRLDGVKNLLATTSLSVEEIARRTGFSSIYYLSRVFRHDVGLTATAYREQVQVIPNSRQPY